jgi:hypothetical protein
MRSQSLPKTSEPGAALKRKSLPKTCTALLCLNQEGLLLLGKYVRSKPAHDLMRLTLDNCMNNGSTTARVQLKLEKLCKNYRLLGSNLSLNVLMSL